MGYSFNSKLWEKFLAEQSNYVSVEDWEKMRVALDDANDAAVKKDWLDERLGEVKIMTDRVYNIRLQSAFILTPTEVKKKLGIGFKVIEVIVEKDNIIPEIKTVDDAFDAIVKTGFRALARSNHPDLGGDPNVMVVLNRAKKEIESLLKELA